MKCLWFVLTVGLVAHAQAPELPKNPYLGQIAQCFRALPSVQGKSVMAFYDEIQNTSGPNCQPKMLVVKSQSKFGQSLDVYRDDLKGKNIEGFRVSEARRGDFSGKTLKLEEVNGNPIEYGCKYSDPAHTQYGQVGKPQPVAVAYDRSPPVLVNTKTSQDVLSSVVAKPAFEMIKLKRSVQQELAIRLGNMKEKSMVAADLSACLGLIENIPSPRREDGAEKPAMSAEEMINYIQSTSSKGPSGKGDRLKPSGKATRG